jgi:hypothetical protein
MFILQEESPPMTGSTKTGSAQPSPYSDDLTSDRWAWLAGTYWYVPTETLPALQVVDIREQRSRIINDQTLWFIERYESGYLIGRAAISLDGAEFSPLTMVGSITPLGDVSVSFTSTDTVSLSLRDGVTTASLSTGGGRMIQRDGAWAFLMQMTNGAGVGNVTHWSYMVRSTPEDDSWTNLPGMPGVSIGEVFAD